MPQRGNKLGSVGLLFGLAAAWWFSVGRMAFSPSLSTLDPKISLEQALQTSIKPVLIFFYTDWCGYCKEAAPVVHEIAKRHSEKLLFVMADAEAPANREAVGRFQVDGYPRIFLYKPTLKQVLRLRPPYAIGKEAFERELLGHVQG